MAGIGVLGAGARARIDPAGRLTHGDVTLDWWVGADDGWHVPADDTTTRFRRRGVAPSFETAVRVPSGDFVQRAYGVATPSGSGAIAIDFENASRAPCSIAVFLRVGARGRVRLDGRVVRLNDTPMLTMARPPRLWAAGPDVRETVRSGQAVASEPVTWATPIEIVVLVPAPHATVLRTALGREELDVGTLPDPDAVERGWVRQLERAARAELPEPWGAAVDAARADLLLRDAAPDVVAALEDWGFDAEATRGWSRLGWRARRAARRRAPIAAWSDVRALDSQHAPAEFLLALRQVLASEAGDHVAVLPHFPPEWLGQAVAVHDLPLRSGLLSFAVRWHGARPALLWDAPAGIELRAPALDPQWRGRDTGEALLGEPPAPLLAMGTAQRDGTRIDRADAAEPRDAEGPSAESEGAIVNDPGSFA